MATLTGTSIAGSYKDLLKIKEASKQSGIDTTARPIEDGDATESLLYLSTTEVYSPGKAGTSNTVFGKSAGAALASGGNYNIIIGEEAGNDLTTGVSNLAIGYQALSTHTTGARNIAIGYGAMDGTAGDVDDAPASTDNIFVGFDAGGGNWEDDEDSNFNARLSIIQDKQ